MKHAAWQATVIALLALTACSQQDAPTAPTQPSQPAVSPQARTSALVEYQVPSDATDAGYCALDTVNGAPVGAPVATGSTVVFGGWVSDADKKAPESAMLVLKGSQASYSVEITGDIQRPDVAAALASDALMNSGFSVSTVLQDVPAGDYQMEIIRSGATPARCPLNAVLTVTK